MLCDSLSLVPPLGTINVAPIIVILASPQANVLAVINPHRRHLIVIF